MHIQVQWQGRYTQITYLSYLCNTRNLLKVWKATLVVKTVSSLADSFLQKQQNCPFILVKSTTAQWQVILSQESIYSWKHFTVQRWTYSSYNEVGKSWQAVNGLFHLIRVPPYGWFFSVCPRGYWHAMISPYSLVNFSKFPVILRKLLSVLGVSRQNVRPRVGK